MKKIMLFATALLLTVTAAVAQSNCDKKVVYHSEKQERLDADGQVQGTQTDVADIEISKENIKVEVAGKGQIITGAVKEVACDWKTPYQEGKVVYKATFSREDGQSSDGTVTVEAKEGKITVLFEIQAGSGRRIRAVVDNYKEQ